MVNGIPVYINQALVSDLTALMFDGYIESKNVRNSEDIEVHFRNIQDNRVQRTLEDRAVVSNENNLEHIHGEIEFGNDVSTRINFTDFSRFNNVRNMMFQNNLIKPIIEQDIINNRIKRNQYAEFAANMMTTSLSSTIDTLIGVIESYDIKVLDNLIREKLSGLTNVTSILNQLKFLSNSLRISNTSDMILNIGTCNVVLTVNLNSFSDKNAYVYDLIHSDLRVLGKVSRIVDETDYFDLLRKTASSIYYNRFLEFLAPYLNILNSNGILVPDNFITRINGPGIHVIPVAIYI